MTSKLTLNKETLHVLSTSSRRDVAAHAAQPARIGANDPKPPSSFTTVWTTPW